MSKDYDIIIIGAGPGGYPAAIRAASFGAKVLLVDKDKLGGTCLHRGCIPSKIGLHIASLLCEIQEAGSWGVTCSGLSFHWEELTNKRQLILNALEGGIKTLLKAHKIDFVAGQGKIKSQHQVEAGGIEYDASKIVIATGSSAGRPKKFLFDAKNILTSEEVFSWKTLPKSLAVLGAGPEGCEWACMFQTMGSSVTLLECQERLLPSEEPWVSRELEKIFKSRKINVLTKTKIKSVSIQNDDSLLLEPEEGVPISVERLLVAVGRVPHFEGLFAEGFSVEQSGAFIKVDDFLQTNISEVYAIGDVNGLSMMAHSATAQGLYAVKHALGSHRLPFDRHGIPHVTFTFPEVARVGPTEQDLKQQGVAYKVGRFPFLALGKAHALGKTEGAVCLISEESTGKILGGSILGAHASELIHQISLAKSAGLTLSQLEKVIFAHPTLSEAISEAAGDTLGMAVHKYKPKR